MAPPVTPPVNGRVVLAFFIVTQVVYLVMVLVTLPHLRQASGGMDAFDLLPGGYGFDDATRFLGALGAEGRSYYLGRQIPLDLVYPGLFALSYALLWKWLLAKATGLPKMLGAVIYLPLFAGLADYAENAGIIAMLIQFPDLSEMLVATASTFTIIKALSSTLFFVALLGLLLAVGVQKIRTRS